MDMRKIFAAALIVLTLSAAAASGIGILAVSNDASKADYMVQTAALAMAEADGAIARLREANITLPEGLNLTYEQALNMSDLAVQYKNQNNYQLCCEYAMQSQHMFMEIVNYSAQIGAGGGTQNIQRAMEALMLRSEVGRAYLLIATMGNASMNAAAYGIDTSGVNGCLEMARLKLGNASLALDNGDLAGANQTVAEANSLIQTASQAFGAVASESDALRARQYLMNALGAVNMYMERVMAWAGLPEGDRTQAMEMLNYALCQLQLANASLDQGNLTLALQQLEQFRLRAGEACGVMAGGDPLRAELELGVMSLQLQAEGLNRRVQTMKGQGYNMSAQEQAMEQVCQELQGIEFANASAGELQLAQIRAHICAMDGEIAGMEEQHRNQEQARVMAGILEMQGRVAGLGERAMQMKGNGSDTGNVEGMLNQANGMLAEANRQLQNGNVSGADALLNQAGQMADQAEAEMNQMGGGGQDQGQGHGQDQGSLGEAPQGNGAN